MTGDVLTQRRMRGTSGNMAVGNLYAGSMNGERRV